ncbi:WD repeat-containing protein CG11141 [Anastrepha ludens]|uniref:WD repeat-containing protein CG11141 n=1 Tax=Anastrepha ludens TaxID=28586 RepID=UPI0023AECC90|nr:WD repeat-containing protein CG11141 [Anastrepha ludens]
MNSKELYSIREWAPLTDIMEKIPVRMTRALGIFPADLNITCVDAISEFLALGSDAGIVFWYDRYNGELQKLRTESTARITCVKIVDSVEYMVAAGNSSGKVSVFQIQKQLPPDLNLVAPCTRAKPIERYTIRDLHNCAVSCVEWSKNGMKLYSGDRQGVVVLTEFDFQAHLSKSVEILSETYEIVQLSVCQSYLLVSSLYRSVVCQRTTITGQWQVTQVGKKDRKVLTDCGSIFLQQPTRRPVLICGRPGLRFWIADAGGNVEKTLLFREAIARSPTWEIPILNPKAFSQRRTSSSIDVGDNDENARSFGKLHLYAGQDVMIVTHDESTLYVLNLDRLRVEAVARGFRKILDFCVCGKEIFVLEGDRSLLRVAPMPEKPSKTAKIIFNPSMPPPVPLLGASIAGAFESPVESFEPSEQPVGKAEECFELPPVEALNLNVPIELAVESPRAEQNRRLEIFNQISEMDFDQSILHHSGISQSGGGRKKRTRHSRERENLPATTSVPSKTPTKSEGIVEIGRVAEPETELETVHKALTAVEVTETKPNITRTTTTKPTLMNSSFCASAVAKNNESEESKSKKTFNTKPNCGFLSTPLSPASPESAKKSLSIKPKSLAEELNLAGISLGPKQSSLDSASPSPTHTLPAAPASTPTPLKELAAAYPKQTKVEDAGVQTTPRKKVYYIEEEDDEGNIYSDYSAGQPIDNLCHAALRAATLVEEYDKDSDSAGISNQSAPTAAGSAAALHLQFVSTQPVNEEISSFLPDFRRACDPCAPQPMAHKETPPPSVESNGSSSEWEFLDN